MKSKDQQLLEEAYSAINKSVKMSDSDILSRYKELEAKLDNREINGQQWTDLALLLLGDIVNSIAKGLAGSGSYDSMSDEQLLELYKNEYDKQFDAGSEVESAQLQNKIKQIYAALKQRGSGLANEASKYAVQKQELER